MCCSFSFSNYKLNYHIWDLKIQGRDGNENVAWKMNLRSFSLDRNYSYPLTLSNVGKPSWSWIPRDHIQIISEREIKLLLLVYILHKTWHLALSRRSRAETANKCTKKCDARGKLLFCILIRPVVFFFYVLIPRASSDLKAPNYQ